MAGVAQIGDVVLDAAGAVGIVIDSTNEQVQYKAYGFDGMSYIFYAPASMVTVLSQKMKNAWLREIRHIRRRHGEDDWSDGLSPITEVRQEAEAEDFSEGPQKARW
jgi:hypothetical protein